MCVCVRAHACVHLLSNHHPPPHSCPNLQLPRLEFPKALSGCVRECFARVPVMDPELRTRLLTWLSYHLSNFEYQWPWDRWVGPTLSGASCHWLQFSNCC